MSFVKLDCGILNSSLWPEKDQRDLFITALLMAEPWDTETEIEQLNVNDLNPTGWKLPPGWYGLVRAAGPGIIVRCGMNRDAGFAALRALGEPDPESRSQAFEGRRLVRIDGGYVVLNYDKYRQRDTTAPERMRRWRDRHRHRVAGVTRNNESVTRNVTQAEAEAEAEEKNKPCSRKRSHCQLADSEFVAALKANPAYAGIDIDRELGKMDAWLLTPRARRRRKTRAFVVNWLNRLETPMKPQKKASVCAP